tara:strand:- start:1078 stop:1413 length:336 start_codon:yes stop_codon:yes gene_type:complete
MNIFIQDFSNNILYDFLNKFCINENNYFVINNAMYKKCIFNNNIDINNFINTIKYYYKKQKLYYLEREINYNNFLTIIRQICKYKNIPYRSIIKYDKSKYEIIYYIKIFNY